MGKRARRRALAGAISLLLVCFGTVTARGQVVIANSASARITVRNVVVGVEPEPGFAYPMLLTCVNPPSTDLFIDLAFDGNIGKGLIAGGAGNYISINYEPLTPFFAPVPEPGGPPVVIPPGYQPGDLVVPGTRDGYLVPYVYNPFNGAYTVFRVYDGRTIQQLKGPLDVVGNKANLDALVYHNEQQVTLRSRVLELIKSFEEFAQKNPRQLRIYDFRTDPKTIPAGAVLGVAGNLIAQYRYQGVVKSAAEWVNDIVRTQTPTIPSAALSLRNGESRTFTATELPGLLTRSVCVTQVIESKGSDLRYSSTVPVGANGLTGKPLDGEVVNGQFVSSRTQANGQTITTTQNFFGDLVISKAVTGDPKTNIATFEVRVSCDRGGPQDTFLLKDRQTKIYNNLPIGTICSVIENRSDGAFASYRDNSGDPNDAKVTVIDRAPRACAKLLTPTPAVPGGPAPTSVFDSCIANLIITNDYRRPPAPPPASATTIVGSTGTSVTTSSTTTLVPGGVTTSTRVIIVPQGTPLPDDDDNPTSSTTSTTTTSSSTTTTVFSSIK